MRPSCFNFRWFASYTAWLSQVEIVPRSMVDTSRHNTIVKSLYGLDPNTTNLMLCYLLDLIIAKPYNYPYITHKKLMTRKTNIKRALRVRPRVTKDSTMVRLLWILLEIFIYLNPKLDDSKGMDESIYLLFIDYLFKQLSPSNVNVIILLV